MFILYEVDQEQTSIILEVTNKVKKKTKPSNLREKSYINLN